jgi:hypothetical protein
MTTKDYLDREYAGYDAQFRLIVEKAGAEPPVWAHIPAAALAALQAAYDDWHPKHLAAKDPARSSIDVRERVDARTRTEPVVRSFCQRYLYNAPGDVSDAQLESMLLRPRRRGKTDHGRPPWRVAIEIEPSKTRTHKIRWYVAETESGALPRNCGGWLLVRKTLEAGEAVPVDPEEMGHGQVVTRNPFVVEHKPGDEGKRIAYCGAFLSRNRGLTGDWGEIVTAVLT